MVISYNTVINVQAIILAKEFNFGDKYQVLIGRDNYSRLK